jgi:phage terminase large subunit
MIATTSAPRRLAYQLYDVQDDFVSDQSRYVAFVGGRNAGKTFCGSIKAFLHAMQPGLGVIAAPNFPMLEHGAKRQFIDRMEESGIPFLTNNQKGNLIIPDTGAEVLFATLESESRVRGPNFNWGWTDELDYLSDQKVWKALMGAIRAGDNPQLFATSTPKGKRLIYREWVQNATERHHLYRATTYDNPFIDADDYVSGLGYEGRFADQEIGAEFVSFDGLVYDGFDRTRNVATVDVSGWRTYCGVDVGARNPTVVLTIHIAGDERVHISREFYQRGMGSAAILDAIETEATASSPESIYIDPSAAAYIDDLLMHGFPAVKAINDIQTGIQQVTSALPRLTVDPSCVHTIAEFEAYQYPDEGKGTSDKPIKQNDHCLVAGTMIETAHGARPIESIQNGELVLTRDGYREVVSAGMTNPSADVLTAYLSSGETITGTAGHPVFANGEWVLLDSLRYGDTLMSVQEITKCASKSSSTKASSSDDTRIPSAWQIGDTIGRTLAISATAFHRCIVRFGKTISGRSPMVTTSTTLTATRTTTTSRIWNASRLAIISAITGTSHHLIASSPTSKRLGMLPPSGIGPMLAANGIASMADAHGKAVYRLSANASNAVASTPISRSVKTRGSAPTNASRHGVAPVASMMKIAPALFAGRRSESTSSLLHELAPVYVERVVAQTERRAVYNLTVSETPEYFANGVLVHNCMDALRYCLMGVFNNPALEGTLVW